MHNIAVTREVSAFGRGAATNAKVGDWTRPIAIKCRTGRCKRC
jgi:hypothetical protein